MLKDTPSQRPHIVWLDVLRFVAMFMVVMCHSTDPFNASPETRAGIWGSVYGALVRACVPLFVVISGALLLPVKEDMKTFYKKRIPRVLFPFLLWSILYNLSPWFIQLAGGSPQLVTVFFPYAPDPSASLLDALKNVVMIPFNFSVYALHMWYIYLLIGLYLFMPIFSAWIEKATDGAKRFFLIMWWISLFLPYAVEFGSQYLFGTCSWNEFGMFYYFAGFNGYLLLGHYMKKGNDWSMGKTLFIAIPLFVMGYVVTYFGFRYMIALPDVTEPGIELFFTYCSPNTMLMTAAVFLVVRKINVHSPVICKALANLTKCGFGIYMAHYFFVGPMYMLVVALGTPVYLQIPISAVLVFAATWIVVYGLSYLPKAKYIIG